MEEGIITAETQHVWPLLRDYLYATREVFVRELMANAADALEKMRLIALKDTAGDENAGELRIDVRLDRGAREITITDNGIGMTYEDVKKYINQMAVSGVTDFAKRFNTGQGMIGSFGVGFYSAFLVAQVVSIETRSWMDREAGCRWVGTPDARWKMEHIDRRERGTTVTLSMGGQTDAAEFLDPDRFEAAIRRYCDFLPYPIYVNGKVANAVVAPWHQSRGTLTARTYHDLYQRLFPKANQPRFWTHLEAEFRRGMCMRGIVYIPSTPEERGRISLFCKRVFVDGEFSEVTTRYLGFLRGVIDVDGADTFLSLPRDKLCNDVTITEIRSFIVRKLADEFARIATERREDFTALWTAYEEHLKMGAIEDDRWLRVLFPHFLFPSSRRDHTTITEYLERSSQHDKVIYYATDPVRQQGYLDGFQSRNREVVYFTGDLDLLLLERVRRQLPELAEFRRIDFEPVPRPTESQQGQDESEQRAFCKLFESVCQGMTVTIERLSYAGSPVVLRRKGADSTRADFEDLVRRMDFSNLKELPDKMRTESWQVVLNDGHPLVEALIEIHRRDQNDPAMTRVCEVLYRETTVKFGLANQDATGRFLSQTEDLLTWVCEQRLCSGQRT